MTMNTKALSIAGLIVALVLLFAVNILSNSVFTATRVDLTENRLFTLSDGTRNILAGLQEPITIRLYLVRAPGPQSAGDQQLCKSRKGIAGRVRARIERDDRGAYYRSRALFRRRRSRRRLSD